MNKLKTLFNIFVKKKKLLIAILIYLVLMSAFWIWFFIGAFYLANRNAQNTDNVSEIVVPRNPSFTSEVIDEPNQPTPVEEKELITLTQAPITPTKAADQNIQQVVETTGSGIPKSIKIQKLNVNTSIERVGLDNEGRMDVPSTFATVGWYELGYKVGGRGSAVLSGHYDDMFGKPAVFWDIGKLENGDLIEIVDTSDVTYTYKVIDKSNYPYNSLPMQKIFASNDKNMLNLITCSGTWDNSTRNYSTRTVVYAEQVK